MGLSTPMPPSCLAKSVKGFEQTVNACAARQVALFGCKPCEIGPTLKAPARFCDSCLACIIDGAETGEVECSGYGDWVFLSASFTLSGSLLAGVWARPYR